MRCQQTLVVALLLAAAGDAAIHAQSLHEAPSLVRVAATPISDHYIVALRGDDDPEAVGLEAAGMFVGQLRHVYRSALRGFSVRLPKAAAEALARDPRILYVQQDGIVRVAATESDAPWGLDRIDQRAAIASGDHAYEYTADGTGVHAYVIDSGIRTTHQEFGGRAHESFTTVNDGFGAQDCYGHGTHVAGIIGGSAYGVAKNVTLHSVRVFDCSGTTSWSSVIAAVDWVIANRVNPAVVNMSLSGGVLQTMNDAVHRAVAAGIVVVNAAGNDNHDACGNSPASTPDAITVGATDASDTRASFSNFGPCVDLFAPGGSITSAYIGGDTATTTMSGTSMASPFVAGAAALYLQRHRDSTPADVSAAILATATAGAVHDAAGTPNRLLFTRALDPIPVSSTRWHASAIGGSQGAVGASNAGGTLTIDAEGADVWGAADAFEFVHRSWFGDGDLIAHLAALVNPADAQSAMAGVMFRDGMSAGSVHATLLVSSDGKAKFRRRATAGGATLSDGPGAGTTMVPVWLRLSRRGDVFRAYVSNDGNAWNEVHTAQTLAMSKTLEVGTFALRKGGTLRARATFTAVELSAPLAGGWSSADVGSVGIEGDSSVASGAFTIDAAGTDLWNVNDAFHFVYRRWTGDGTFVARLASIANPAGSLFTLGAITFRENLNDGARHVSLVLTSLGKTKLRRRLTTGGTTLSDGPPATGTFSAKWLKLTRSGNVFTASVSTDGTTWQQIASPQNLALPATTYVGLVALRSGGTALARTTFSNVVVK